MKSFGTGIFFLLIALILAAGCTSSSPTPSTQPFSTTPAQPLIIPAVTPGTPVPVVTTSAPQAIVTVIHYIVPTKAWKDSSLHITFSAPQDWNVTTRPLPLPEGSQGLVYQTDLVSNDIFYITTFPISLSDDQAYRDMFRKWDPVPVQTTVTINGIVFDRFESTNGGITQVGYVAQKSSANDLGFSSVLRYTTDSSRLFDKEDFEKVIASFTYFTARNATLVPGEEIPHIR